MRIDMSPTAIRRRQHVKKWDKTEDLEVYGVLKQEWETAASQAVAGTPPRAPDPPSSTSESDG